MLIEFSVTNFRSFRERQTLSLVASSDSEHRRANTADLPNTKLGVLRTAALYGANASGKSNLLRALQALQRMVLLSAQGQAGVLLPVQRFALSQDQTNKPSTFEITFVAPDGVRYDYSCAVSAEKVHQEALLAYPLGLPQMWFERVLNSDGQTYDWTFGRSLKGEKKVSSEFTRPNALFLSTAVQLNNEQMKPVFDWFLHYLIVEVHGQRLNPALSLDLMKMPDGLSVMNEFMRAADVGIERLELRESEMTGGAQSTPVLGEMSIELQFQNPAGTPPVEAKRLDVFSWHRTTEGQEIAFPLIEESDGTRKFFELAGGWIKALDTGATLLVDELDRSLHPHLTRYLVQLFQSERNAKAAQLVFTTHDTTLLDLDLVRRDQVWFVEKMENHASTLVPLLEYRPRKGEALERGYLKGRYGAVPVLVPPPFRSQ